MPPSIALLATEPETGLASLEAKVESNMKEISNLKREQHNISQKLEFLQDSNQDLLKKLNAIKSDKYIQEINSLRAENQLLQPDSGIFSGQEGPDHTPAKPPVMVSRHCHFFDFLIDMYIGDTGNATRRIKSEHPSLVPNDNLEPDLATDRLNIRMAIDHLPFADTVKPSPSTNVVDEDTTIWLNSENFELEIAENENKVTSDAWKTDGEQLRETWKKQLKEFNKKNPEWSDKARTAGCVRSVLWNQSKCYLTLEGEGLYACKTCWNTGHFCVAWDEESGYFWLRPQVPGGRTKGKSIGPFDLEKFHSMKLTASRSDLPAYWSKEFTA
ncbi:hypothetical protein E4T49_05631 [Aureobasidium sp. EXF-10728]|nr:hypothetical protein E4T49_05631 [Aureobasidium sp. EXF-10728]